MGTLRDTTVFIALERTLRRSPPQTAMTAVSRRLQDRLGPDDEVAIAAITASELLHGVRRATSALRARREAFVEAVLTAFPPVPFDLLWARAHSRLWAELASTGTDIGPNDRLVAAITTGWNVGTANVRHFTHVPGLSVIDVELGA